MFEIGAALSSFTAIKTIGKSIYDAKIDGDVKEKVREILEQLGDAQDVLYSLREELLKLQGDNAALKQQLEAASKWQEKIEQFELKPAAGGALVLHHESIPGLFACVVCANEQQILPLQDNRNMSGTYSCPKCNAVYPIKAREQYVAPALNYPRTGMV